MKSVVYDASVLVAADKSDQKAIAAHKLRLTEGTLPIVPSPVLAQVIRSSKQVQFRMILKGCLVLPFEEKDAHEVGKLLARSHSSDVVDGAVVVCALRYHAEILTGDPKDIHRLVQASGQPVSVCSL